MWLVCFEDVLWSRDKTGKVDVHRVFGPFASDYDASRFAGRFQGRECRIVSVDSPAVANGFVQIGNNVGEVRHAD